jgi:hypothetical protein
MRAAASIRHHSGALGVGIFGCAGADTHLFASSGPHDRIIARRAFDAGLIIGPESTSGWVSVAVPMRYLGRFIGALSLRWTSEGPANVERARAFGGAATAACAPLVYVLQERQGVVCPNTPVSDLIGVSSAMGDVMRAVGARANTPFTVLIEGESGAGRNWSREPSIARVAGATAHSARSIAPPCRRTSSTRSSSAMRGERLRER